MSAAGQGSVGNVVAAVCSLFIPGLGWIIHRWPILDAAMFKPNN